MSTTAQSIELSTIPAAVDFSKELREWDGFGFNYVETAQTRDYGALPQDYGGFSLLGDRQKREVIQLVFGEDGLDVDIVKMFLDPWHQARPGGAFDHATTTEHMMHFVREGLKTARKHKEDLTVVTTLYGPPPWATAQKHVGGRDLDARQADNLALYIVDWIRYLQERDVPVRYVSMHNEGEDFYRWTYEEGTQRLERFDYNMYWPPEQVNALMKTLARALDHAGIGDVGVTNGEPSNWTRFYHWGYADALHDDDEALAQLDLLTTHGFINGDFDKLSFSTANSLTCDLLRSKKPGLHAWVTSFSWGDMGTRFVRMVHENIYSAKVNGVIPWAGIQDPEAWIGGDVNSGTAFRVQKDGSFEVTIGYYFYKQLTTAGHAGMAVAYATLANPLAHLIAFSGSESGHPDAFVLTSDIRMWGAPIEIRITGTEHTRFRAFRTNQDKTELYESIGEFAVSEGVIWYDPPGGTTTTFIGVD